MDQLKEEKISRFAALGVAAEDIFRILGAQVKKLERNP